jgi:hypothetical protein
LARHHSCGNSVQEEITQEDRTGRERSEESACTENKQSKASFWSLMDHKFSACNEGELMADNGEGAGSAGVVAIVAIFVLVILGALYVFRGKIFGGGSKTSVDVNISAPSK